MRPFDLKAALAGAPVVMRNGVKIEWLAHDPKAPADRRIVARGKESSHHGTWYEDGSFVGGIAQSSSDLFMATTKREGWVNVYPGGGTSWIHPTKEMADALSGSSNRVDCVRIEWEE
jgi:hypothetical protein